jgi:hypothetical protein
VSNDILTQRDKEISKGSIIYPVTVLLRLPLYIQEAKRNDELKSYISKENLEDKIRKLLKKVKKENLEEKLSTTVEDQIRGLPNIDFEKLSKVIDETIF